MEINLSKKHFAIAALICLILLAGLAVANQEVILRLASPNPKNIPLPERTVGHSSEDIVVNLDDLPTGGALCTGDMALQEAIDNRCFGTGGASLGEWVDLTSSVVGGEITQGPATTDGFVVVNSENLPRGFTDSEDSPTTLRVYNRYPGSAAGFTMPVKKGNYWKVSGLGSPYGVYWIPLLPGRGGAPDEILEEGPLETGGDSRNAENYCVSLSNATRECHYGAGMDNDGGAEYIYCWCWNI